MKVSLDFFTFNETIDFIPNFWVCWVSGFDIGIGWLMFNLVLTIHKK